MPGHWQHCAFQPVKRGDVSRATRIGKIVKMLGVDEMQSKVNNDDYTLMSILMILRVSCTGIGAEPWVEESNCESQTREKILRRVSDRQVWSCAGK